VKAGRKLVFWVLLPLATVVLIALSLPYILRSIDYKALLVWQLENQLNRKVELGNAAVEFFPHVRITLEGMTVRERESPSVFLSADRLFVDLRIFPLLRRKVVVKRILLDNPMLLITRGEEGRLNVADLFTSGQADGIAVPMLGDEVSITEGQITFTDAFQTETPRTLVLDHLNINLKSEARETTFRISAAIPRENAQSTLALTAKAPRQATKDGTLGDRVEGRLEVRNVELAQLAPFLEKRFLLQGAHGIVQVSAGFEYRAGKEEDSLTLTDLRLNAGGTTITGSALIKGILTKPAGFVASLKTTQFRLESVTRSFSEEMLRAYGLEFLTTTKAGGLVRLVSLRVTGDPDRTQPVSIQAEIELLDGQAVIGSDRVLLSDVRTLLRVDTDHIGIERLTAKYGLAEVTDGRGEITHIMKDPELYLALKARISAQELATIVARFAPKTVLPEGTAGLKDLSGETDATVLLSGSLAHPDDFRVEWALEADGLAFADARLRFPVTKVYGKVRSISSGLVFEQVTGMVGNSAVAVEGTIRYPAQEKTTFDFSVTGRGDVRDLWVTVIGAPPDGAVIDGTTEFKASLSGPADQLRTTGNLDLTHTSVTNGSGWGKPGGVQSNLEFNVLLDAGHLLRLDRVFFEIPPFNVLMKGNVFLEDPRRFALNVRVPPVALRTLPKSLLGTIIPTGGNLQGDFTAEGSFENWKTAGIRGRASIKNVGFKMEKLEHPVEELSFDIAVQDNRIDLERAAIKIEDSRIMSKATIRGWRGVPMVEVVFESPGMDLDLLIPKGERSPLRTAMETITKSAKLSGNATIRNGLYKGIEFEEIRAKLIGGDSKLVIDSLRGRLHVGMVTGQVTLLLMPDQPIGFESSLILDKVPVEPFIQGLGIQVSPVTGLLSLKSNVRGDTGNSSSLNGNAQLIVSKGYFQKYAAASKVIGLLNLPSLLSGKVDFSDRGMPFDCLSAQLHVKDGVAKIDRYLVDSPIMKMTAAGTYDIPNNRVNVVLAASPLGSYHDFLKSIPVFGKLFVGESQELVTAFYEVKGPLEDPKVRALPIRSVASGMGAFAMLALDLMKNVFLLPKELLDPTKTPPSPCAAF
jgi:hypothetical protein